MPVHMEWIESPTEQDWIDLEKLYKEAPSHWFEGESSAESYGQIKRDSEHKWVAGRFNDRLIAAATLKADADGVMLIDDLCVRQVTQDRGVAKQLIVRICQWADNQGESLKVLDAAAKYQPLADLGFVHQNEYWVRTEQK